MERVNWVALALSVFAATASGYAGGTISGAVVDINTAPIEGVTVSLYEHSWEGRVAASLADLRTDANGEYSIDNVPPGSYSLMFVAEGYAWHWEHEKIVQDNATTQVDVTLVTGGSISGTCQVNDTGQEGVFVFAWKDGWRCGGVQTDENGDYLIEHVEPGTYCLEAAYYPADHYASGSQHAIEASVQVTSGQNTGGHDFSLRHPNKVDNPVAATLFVHAVKDNALGSKVRAIAIGGGGHVVFRPNISLNLAGEGYVGGEVAGFHSLQPGGGYEVRVLSSTLGTGTVTNLTLDLEDETYVFVPVQ